MAIISKIEEMIEDPEMLKPENLGQLLNEMLRSFAELKTLVESKDDAIRNEAQEMIARLKVRLDERVRELCQSVGMDPKGFEKYIKDPSHFNQEEWAAMEQTQSEIADFSQELKRISQEDIIDGLNLNKPKIKKLIDNLI